MLYRLVFLILLTVGITFPLKAANVNLTVTQKSLQDSVLIEVLNTSTHDVTLQAVEITLDQKKYVVAEQNTIKAGESKDFIFSVHSPQLPGSYVLLATVRYLNDGASLTVMHADFFHSGIPSLLSQTCTLQATSDYGGEQILLNAPRSLSWNLVAPEEITIKPIHVQGETSTYQANSTMPGLSTINKIFATTETVKENRHHAAICSAVLTTNPGHRSVRVWIPGYIFLIFASVFFTASMALIYLDTQSKLNIVMLRYGSRMFFLSTSCWILKEAGSWLSMSVGYVAWSPFHQFARILQDTITGGNYQYFFQYFVDWFFVACLAFVFPFLYVFDGHRPLSIDKYVALFNSACTLPKLFTGKKPAWNSLAKLGFLTIMVKFFFTPMMVSWAIGSVFNMINSFRSFQWDVYAINAYLVQLLILMDTVIFSAGYLIESHYLKNEIKSVDPTVLGWMVCLWCYPPFNAFSFKALDFSIIRISLPCPAWLNIIVLCAITCLWGVFVWTSVALGFKASNLTNRGIVRSGPYRYVRHPAYITKLSIWTLQGVFFAQFGIFILLGFIIIYVLRAWTEERHLSRDPDYLDYKQSVRWWFIPGII